tara:strand:+ start:106 stop:399 length:294 start_codon:yes stop_codon:yes gene_type:complete
VTTATNHDDNGDNNQYKDKRQLTMNFMQTPKTDSAHMESKNLAAQIIEVYNLTKAPTPYYAPEWTDNPFSNERRQRSVGCLVKIYEFGLVSFVKKFA